MTEPDDDPVDDNDAPDLPITEDPPEPEGDQEAANDHES